MDTYWKIHYLSSTNQLISSIEGGSGMLIVNLDTGQSETLTFSENKSIENFVVTKNDIVYGYSNDDHSLYQVNLDNGNLSSSIDPSVDIYWEIHYLSSTNQLISSIEGGSGMLIMNLDTGQSETLTFSENKSIEKLVIVQSN